MSNTETFTAFIGVDRLAAGALIDVARAAKNAMERDSGASIAIFDDATARPVDLDLRGSQKDVADRLRATRGDDAPGRGPGRPKLGVVPREVTLLPRHWEWLSEQPGGASVALRKLVEAARRSPDDAKRRAQEAANRFMTAMAGNAAGYEEATRALFAGNAAKFAAETASWPRDVRDYATQLAKPAFQA